MKKVSAIMAVLVVMAAPARASHITLDFTSAVLDLSSVGGAASNTFSGSVTWDPAALSTGTDSFGGVVYPTAGSTFIFNAVDVSADITFSRILIYDNYSNVEDIFKFIFAFFPRIPITGTLGVVELEGNLVGLTSMFSSTALPGDLSFLGSVDQGQDLFGQAVFSFLDPANPQIRHDPVLGFLLAETHGGTAVPEPASLSLLVLGLVGGVARYRRRHPHSLS